MYRRQLLMLIALVIAAAAPVATSQEKGDSASLQGKWTVMRMVHRGALKAEKDIAGMFFAFSGEKAHLESPGEKDKPRFTFKIDSTKKPKQIDFTAEDGPLTGQTRLGIYQLDGVSLLLCFSDDHLKKRPDAFESLGGVAPPRMLLTLKRVKD